ncbi:MAG: glycolate oxidase subunit GlcE [Steroidobacteraceae bacterium]
MIEHDATESLVDQVRTAHAAGTALRITGGDSKAFLGRTVAGEPLEVAWHRGVVTYDPGELVITARAGTPLREVEALLAGRGQRLPFEPPGYGMAATIGGTVACGLAGPSRAWAGPLRNHVLGVRVLAGDGRVLRFGGEVMKNVAGYDLARTFAGSHGTLGVLLDVSLKVLPCPPATRTLALELDQAGALARLVELARGALPLTASSWHGGRLHLRFEGSERTLDEVAKRIGGETIADGAAHWRAVREHEHGYFVGARELWQLLVPPETPPLPLPGAPLVEWNGMQRWYAYIPGTYNAGAVVRAAREAGGHATAVRRTDPRAPVYTEPAPALLELHRALKRIFDPAGILNPGRMYEGL